MQYNQPANSLHFDLAGVTRQSISTTAATFSIPVAMSSQKITGLLAGAGGSTDAANVAQMEAADLVVTNAYIAADTVVTNAYIAANTAQTTAITNAYVAADTVVTNAYIAADNLRVRHDGSTAMTGSLNMNSNSVNNVVNVRSPTATDLVLGRTGTGTEIQIKATEILIGKDLTLSGANINMGTGYIGLQAGVNPTDAVNKGQLDGAGTTLTSAYIAADAVVTNNSVQKTGSTMTGTLTINNIQTFLQATHTAAPLIMSLSAGTASVPQTCSMKLASNSQSYTEFTDVAGVTKAWIRYLASGGGSIDLTVANNAMITLTSSTVTLGGTAQLGGNRVTGMGAPTADTDAATRLYVTNADAAVVASSVQKNGSTMSGSLNMGGTNRVTNMAASSVDGDAVRRQELYGVFLPLNGGTMTGPLDMFSQNINGIPDAVSTHQPVSWDQIRANSIVPTAWRSGQMIQRKYLCPALSNTLLHSSIAGNSSESLISTTLTVTAYNHVLVRGGFEIDCTGSGSDTFRMVFEHQTQTVAFNNVVGPTASFRERYTMYEHLFLPTSSGTKTLTARLYNDSTTGDTITVNTGNWIWAVEEIQA
jgi:hypothetical protein